MTLSAGQRRRLPQKRRLKAAEAQLILQKSNIDAAISAAQERGCGLAFFGDRVFIVPEQSVKLEDFESLPTESAFADKGDALVSFARFGVRAKERG